MSDATSPQASVRKEPTSAMVIAIVGLCVAIVAGGLSLVAAARKTNAVTTSGSSAQGTTEAAIELRDISVAPDFVNVVKGAKIKLNVVNKGALVHDLVLADGKGTKHLDAGAQQSIEVGPFTASTKMWCSIPGHKEAGMVLDLVVGAAAPSGTPAGNGANPDDAKIDFAAAPAPEWKAFDPTLAPAPGGTEHEITLRAQESVVQVAPGVTQQLWTFNGTAPGPTLRGKVGDVFTVTLVNDGKVDHSVDFHASRVAWNVHMRSIKPGESLKYQFKAEFAGVWMYHCGTAPALHHIGNGMYGAVVIDPPNLPAVDHEYMFVQSELYTGPMGEPGNYNKMQAEAWDAIVFNGYVSQYKFQPIRVEPGERIRVYVLDAGPSENSAFHIVGTIFDTTFKEGTYTLQPDARNGGSQVLDLQPAQGGFVEFSFAEAGLYPIVTHKFANVGKGALGLFQAGDVAPADGASH